MPAQMQTGGVATNEKNTKTDKNTKAQDSYQIANRVYQPDFDPRIKSLTMMEGRRLDTGKIIAWNPSVQNKKKISGYAEVGVRFLYNPTEIDLSFSANPNSPPPVDRKNPYDFTRYLGSTGEITWSLLFDRTYETWSNPKTTGKFGGVHQFGCYVDVRQFYQLFGMLPPPKFGPNDPQKHKTLRYELQTRPMTPSPVKVYFGSVDSLVFYGTVNGFNVTYTHFTSAMTPNRCVVNISMSSWVDPTRGKGVSAWRHKNAKSDKGGKTGSTSGNPSGNTTGTSGTTKPYYQQPIH